MSLLENVFFLKKRPRRKKMKKEKLRGKKIKKDIAINLFFAVTKIIILLWVVRISSSIFDSTVLGAFLLARKYSSTGATFFQLGFSQTLLRYISMNVTDKTLKRVYVLWPVHVWMILLAIFVLVFPSIRDGLAAWLFPNTYEHELLTLWTGILLFVLILHYIVSAALMAERCIVIANVFTLMNVGGFLLVVLWWQEQSATPVGVLRFQTSAMASLSLVVLAVYLYHLRSSPWPEGQIWLRVGLTFVSYGIPRSAVTFLDTGLLLIGPWLLRYEPDEAGFLLVALTVIQTLQAAILPITQITSIVTARFVSHKDEESISEGIRLVFGAVLYITVLLLAILIPWSELLMRVWLHDAAVIDGVLRYFPYLISGILPYAIFQGLKGIIEMRWFRPLNLYTLLLGVGVQLVVYALLQPALGTTEAVCISILAAFFTVGIMTIVWMSPYLRPISYWGCSRLAAVAAALVALNARLAHNSRALDAVFAIFISATVIFVVLGLAFPTLFVHSFRKFFWPLPMVKDKITP
jgi:hypothetical protein